MPDFRLPDLGEGVTEAEVERWLVEEGQTIAEDAPLVEVITDKATAEIPSPFAGMVNKIHVKEGDIVPVGTVLVTIGEDGAATAAAGTPAQTAVDDAAANGDAPPSASPVAQVPPTGLGEAPAQAGVAQASDDSLQDPAPGANSSPDAAGREEPSTSSEQPPAATTDEAASGVKATPTIRKLARDLGVEISAVHGTGPGGRITREDVEKAASIADRFRALRTSPPVQATTPSETPTPGPAPSAPAPSEADAGPPAVSPAVPYARPVEAYPPVQPYAPPEPQGPPAPSEPAREQPGEPPPLPTVEIPPPSELPPAGEVPPSTDVPPPGEVPGSAEAPAPVDAPLPAQAPPVQAPPAGASPSPAEVGHPADPPPPIDVPRPADLTQPGEVPPPLGAPAQLEQPSRLETPAARSVGAPADPTDRRVPLRGIRRTIAERLTHSHQVIPPVTHVEECDLTALDETRRAANDKGASPRLSFLPFIVKAVAATLPAYPALNASLDDEAGEIVYHGRYDIGVAVDTPNGLVVPVVRAADEKGLSDVAQEIETLAAGARDGTLMMEQLRGSTFTVTSPGAFGGLMATPIILHPQTGILGVHRASERPVVREGQVVIRLMVNLSITFDHRVLDGVMAARFLLDVIKLLEDPGVATLGGSGI